MVDILDDGGYMKIVENVVNREIVVIVACALLGSITPIYFYACMFAPWVV